MKAEGGRRKAEGGKWKGEGGRRKAEGGALTTDHGPLTTGHSSPFPLPPSPFRAPSPLSPFPFPSRRGITLLEILWSMAILLGGLLCVAMLIPVGKLAMMAANRSDRTGACGRAALHQIKVQKLLDTTVWPQQPTPSTNVFFIDPIGAIATGATPLGGLTRVDIAPGGVALTQSQADAMFRWQDDLIFVRPEEMKATPTVTPPPAGTRPVVPSGIGATSEGTFSWFVTVTPDPLQATLFNVAVVVCQKRVLTPDNERLAPTSGTLTCLSPSYGGNTVTYLGDIISPTPPIKNDSWVLLYSTGTNAQSAWYRVVSAGFDGTNSNITLVGPDWYGGAAGYIVVVGGVTGVYTETVQLN